MAAETPRGPSHLFLIRIWAATTPDGGVTWRGRVQRVTDGIPHAFAGLPALVDVLLRLLVHTP